MTKPEMPLHIQDAFEARVLDKDRVALAPEFVAFVRATAAASSLFPEEVWTKWQDYSRRCEGYDQSPVKSEFLEWYGLNTWEAKP